MLENIVADLLRLSEGKLALRPLVRGFLSQGFQAMVVYRFFRWLKVNNVPSQPFRFIFERLVEITTGISIPVDCEIGKGFRIHHFGGIIFHPSVNVGRNCTIYNGVTVGDRGGDGKSATIGNNVLIGAGAKIIGEITIGNNCTVGANAVIRESVPHNSVIVGNPAVVKKKQDVDEVSKRPINLMELRSTYTTGGGPDKTILLSAEKHDKTIVNPIVVYLKDIHDNNFQIGKMSEGRGFPYFEVLDRSKIDIKSIVELDRIVKENAIDIIHGHDYKTDILAYILSIFNPKIQILSTAHGWITNTLKGALYKWIHLLVLRKFNHLIAVSLATKKLMVKSGIEENNILVLYNSIDVNFWENTGKHKNLKKEWNIPESANVVGTVGRISDEKDYYTFLKIAKTVLEKKSNVFFVIIGEGKQDEKEGLIAFAKELGIKNHLFFTGFRSDLLNVYSTFDIFLMTSITEGLPNTMLEAMSLGTAVVSTSVGGIPELIQDQESGFLFPVKDVCAMSEKVINLLEDKDLSEKVSQNARKRIIDDFSFDNRTKKIESIYQNIQT